MTYADTSALVKLLVVEEETTPLRALLGPASSLSSSELTIAELTRVAARRGAQAGVTVLLDALDLLPLDGEGLARAGRLPAAPGTVLRTADAIHLVAALDVGEADVLTYDRRQAQAAAHLGFRVLAPGRPDGWFR